MEEEEETMLPFSRRDADLQMQIWVPFQNKGIAKTNKWTKEKKKKSNSKIDLCQLTYGQDSAWRE